MVSLFEAVILGIVQGVTEWLPISSSGHVVLMRNLLGIEQPISFDIIIHLGSLFAVIFVLRKTIVDLIKGVVARNRQSLLLVLYLVIGTVPIALFGFLAKDWLESVFNSTTTVGIGLLFTSVLLFSTRIERPVRELGWKQAAGVGIMQAAAIFPGVSRSGTTISTCLLLGIRPEDAARFSFLLFIPAILGATVLEAREIVGIEHVGIALIGFFSSLIVGYLTLRLLFHIIRKGRFDMFGWYTLSLGIIILVLA